MTSFFSWINVRDRTISLGDERARFTSVDLHSRNMYCTSTLKMRSGLSNCCQPVKIDFYFRNFFVSEIAHTKEMWRLKTIANRAELGLA